MARRCVTDNTPGLCCAALTSGIASGQVFTHPDHNGRARCHVCTIINRSKNRGKGFQHRFAKNSACNIISGCPSLAQAGGGLAFGGGGGAVPAV